MDPLEREMYRLLVMAFNEGKKQEGLRIIDMMNKRDVGGVNPEWALSDKEYQALREGK